MTRKRELSQPSYNIKEENPDNFCIVCSVNKSENNNNYNNCDTLHLQQNDVDLAQIFSIFCKYFKLNSSQFTNLYNDYDDKNSNSKEESDGNGQNILPQFCSKCMNLLEKLCSQDEQLKALQNDISHTVALLTCNILQQNRNTNTSTTSQSLETESGDGNNQTHNQTEEAKVAQIIRQQFSPRVVVQDLYKQKNSPSQNQIQSQINFNTDEQEEEVKEEEKEVIKDEQNDNYLNDDDVHCDNIESDVIIKEEPLDDDDDDYYPDVNSDNSESDVIPNQKKEEEQEQEQSPSEDFVDNFNSPTKTLNAKPSYNYNTINFEGTNYTIKKSGKRVKCPIENCRATHKSKGCLKIHMEMVHGKPKLPKKKREAKIKGKKTKIGNFVIPPDPENMDSEEEKELLINLNGRDWRIDKLTNGKFKCPYETCMKGGVHSTIELVKIHMNQSHKGKKRIKKKCYTRIEMASSSRYSDKKYKYKCKKCEKTFHMAHLAVSHYKSTHVIPVIPIENCENNIPIKPNLTHGPTPGTFVYHKEWLIETIGTEENNSDSNAFRCGACQVETKTQSLMLGHITDIHLQNMTRYSRLACPICSYTCSRAQGPQYFLRHVSRHWTDEEVPDIISVGLDRFLYKGKWFFGHRENEYKCFECIYERPVISSQEEMIQHFLSQHDEIVICEYCGDAFRSTLGLRSHMRNFGDHSKLQSLGDGKFIYRPGEKEWPFEKIEHHFAGLKERLRFKCGTCLTEIWDLACMKAHIKDRHEAAPESFVCYQCGKSYSFLSGLRGHVQGAHSEEFPFTCPVCGLRVKTGNQLRRHQEKHKEWKCPNCNKIFQYKMGLKRHMRINCSGIEGNNCPKCLVYFKKKESLQLHIDSGECTENTENTENSTSTSSNKNRAGKKLPRKRKETIPVGITEEEESVESSSESQPKKPKTEITSISISTPEAVNDEEQMHDQEEEEELLTEVWTFDIDQNESEPM